MRKVAIGALLVVGIALFFIFRDRSAAPEQSAEKLVIKGSDTEVQLVSNLAEAFAAGHPGADISVTGGGSGVGIAALINGEIDLANSSRAMNDEEKQQAANKGRPVQEFIMARDGLSIIVHPENKLGNLTMEQVGRIYRGEVKTWEQLGGGPNRPVVLYGRQSNSGTYVFFRDVAVKADYAPGMKNMEGNQAIVDSVKADINGIGYVGAGYLKGADGKLRTDVKVVPIVVAGGKAVTPFDEEAIARKYPLMRPLFQYMNVKPAPGSLLHTFLSFEASDEGRRIAAEAGFFEIIPAEAEQNRKLLE